ncbi:DUF871 domain-containing protein [Bacillus sp. FJAT-50079]|uniref:DUF871 domain-containing protein n=1 Tax=Bacillus sp. FJAT-50079 TaxID=2833577 RepID=UPI001BC9F218|nr:DUF871 domain-containing protein [Bacillus sp. FJAT-50079]
MRRLGIAVYPQYGTEKDQIDYIEKASTYGFTRIFTCLMSADENDVGKLRGIVKRANQLGFEVIADISPTVFEEKQLSYKDLAYFKELGLSGLRLDLGFTGLEESVMSLNEYGLSIELNMSQGTKYLEQILSYQPNKYQIIGCHNFYPRRYTGLSREHFIKCSQQYKEHGIRTAAMISSNFALYGPWPVHEGLPTLEEHRGIPIDLQAKDLFQTDLIDDVIIGNAFASVEELKLLSAINRYQLELKVEFNETATNTEREIVLASQHVNRGDVSAYVIRSTESRVQYVNEDFPAHNTQSISRGNVTIDNSGYERYKGEMQIAILDMENSGNTNIVATVNPEEQFLLDRIRPWQKFKLVEK